jgi:hypothetical protein
MSELPTTVERALELARSGACISVNDVRQRLRREGFQGIGLDLAGVEINREIVALIHAARR